MPKNQGTATEIPFPTSSSPGARPELGGGRLINAFTIKNEDGARTQKAWRRSPGLKLTVPNVVLGTGRGLLQVPAIPGAPELLYMIINDHVMVLQGGGSGYLITDVGILDTNVGLVTMASNNATPTQILCVEENGIVFQLFPNIAPVQFADPNLPVRVTSVCNHRGYFVFTYQDGSIFTSGLNDITVDPAAFTVGAGRLKRGIGYGEDLVVFGEDFYEVYRDAGTIPFPYAWTTRVPRGLAGKYAIAGFDAGSTQDLIWVADNNTVVKFNGSNMPDVISTDDVARAITSVADKETLRACTYSCDGHYFWTISDGDNWTWEYNNKTGSWNERQSAGLGGWRVSRVAHAFGAWIALDSSNGQIYTIDGNAYDENGDELAWTVESGIIAQFPNRFLAPRADFDMVFGTPVQLPPGITLSDPEVGTITTSTAALSVISNTVLTAAHVHISWSDDGGYSFGTPIVRTSNTTRDQIIVHRTGYVRSRGKRFRLNINDPIYAALMGGTINAGLLAE